MNHLISKIIENHHKPIILFWFLLLVYSLVVLLVFPNQTIRIDLTGARYTDSYFVEESLLKDFEIRQGTTLALIIQGKDKESHLKNLLIKSYSDIQNIFITKGRKNPNLTIYLFKFKPDLLFMNAQFLVKDIKKDIKKWSESSKVKTYLTGNLAFYTDIVASSKKDTTRAEVFAFIFAFFILIFSFGSIVSSVLPLLMGATTLIYVNAIINTFSLPLNPMSQILNSLMGLALAIDYSLFIVSRFQEEIHAGHALNESIKHTMKYAGKTILFSALIVMISIAVLMIPDVSVSRVIAFNLILVIIFSVINSLIFLPGFLMITWKYLNWPEKLTRLINKTNRYIWWKSFATHVVKFPWRYFLISSALLCLLASPALNMKLWEPVQTLVDDHSESMQGFRLLEKDGWGSEMTPIPIIVTSNSNDYILSKKGIAYIYELTKKLQGIKEVKSVKSITSWNPDYSKEDFVQLYENLPMYEILFPQIKQLFNQINQSTGSHKHLIYVYQKNIMDISETFKILQQVKHFEKVNSDFSILGGGMAARARDFTKELYDKTPLMVILILTSIFILLLIYMKAIILPIKAGIMNFLPIMAAFGIMTLIFQYGYFHNFLNTPINGAIINTVPITLFCIIFGLSMDYEILILSRITEAYRLDDDVQQAVIEGIARSGSVITGAALILLAVFLPSAFSSSSAVKEIGIGIVSAILLDATIVRLLLVPSFIILMGKWNWWLPERIKKQLAK